MEKITIYTMSACPYCKTIKEELNKNNIEFEEKITSENQEEWNKVTFLTKMPTTPTICYKNNYFVPQRDFGNPEGLIYLLKNFKESEFDLMRQNNEAIKTLNNNVLMGLNQMNQVLNQMNNKLNIKDNEHKSTD